MRLLVVEDDPTISSFLVKGLEEAGYAVDAAADGTRGPTPTLRNGAAGFNSQLLTRPITRYGGSGGRKEWSVLGFHYGPGKLIKTGDVLKGTVRLQLLGGNA